MPIVMPRVQASATAAQYANQEAILPGQLEVVVGIRPYKDTVMSLFFSRQFAAEFGSDGSTAGASSSAFTFGSVRFSDREDTLNGKDVWHVHWESITLPRKYTVAYEMDAKIDYWVSKDGHILRQAEQWNDLKGLRSAVADYADDHIDYTSRLNGHESKMTINFVSDERKKLDRQFEPMVVDGNVVEREKTYLVFLPVSGGLEERTARVSGKFNATECRQKFSGYTVSIEFRKIAQNTCVSDDNDLVQVQLPNDQSIEMMTLPENRQNKSQ